MDRAVFLHSSGGIVANDSGGKYVPQLLRQPYIERVALPAVIVDSSAIYGDRPEDLATLTVSSGGAITFFVDSVAGGNDTRGNGSCENPWRSLNTAYRFLECNQCVLCAAAAFVQIKVRGTVDYCYQSNGIWNPFRYSSPEKLIIRGWDEKCDLGGSNFEYDVGYLLNVSGRAYGYPRRSIVCSDCTLTAYGGGIHGGIAIDCLLPAGGELYCAYNCSAASGVGIGADVCWGGSFTGPIIARYAYRTAVSVNISAGGGGNTIYGAIISSAAVSADISVVYTRSGGEDGYTYAGAVGVATGAYGMLLSDCRVQVTARAWGSAATAVGRAISTGAPLKDIYAGGEYLVTADAHASGTTSAAASALASIVDSASIVSGAVVRCSTGADAHITGGDGQENEWEAIRPDGTLYWESRWRQLSNGAVVSSSSRSGVM